MLLIGGAVAWLAPAWCQRSFVRIGEHVVRWLHGSQWKARLKPDALRAFAERCFYALVHLASACAGGWMCWRFGWLTSPGEFFFTLPWPHELPRAQRDAADAYYAFEGACALESSFTLALKVRRVGARRHFMMIVHHAVTLLLMSVSSRLGILEVGSVVLWLHATSDVAIDVLKAADDLRFEAALVPLGATAIGAWAGLRFGLLPLHVLRPGWLQIQKVGTLYRDPNTGSWPDEFFPGTLAWIGLVVLTVLHFVWFVQLVAKVNRVARRNA